MILSWQFDTHVKENKNYTVTGSERILKGTVRVGFIILLNYMFYTHLSFKCWCLRSVSSYQPDGRDSVRGGRVGSHQYRRQSHRPVPSSDQQHPARPAPPQSPGPQPDSCGLQLDHQRTSCSGTTDSSFGPPVNSNPVEPNKQNQGLDIYVSLYHDIRTT